MNEDIKMYLILFVSALMFHYLLGLKNVAQVVTTGNFQPVHRVYRTLDFVNIPE